MTKRRPPGGGRAVKRHLYLLFDDWPAGYSIRKVDLPSDDFGPDEACSRLIRRRGWQMSARGRALAGGGMVCAGEQRLPPAIFRLEAQRGLPMYFAAAFDTKILALQPIAPATALPSVLQHHVPAFDVRMRSCLFAPRPESSGADPIYIPAGGRLYALGAGTFDWLDPPPPPPPDRPAYGEEASEWLWFEIPDPPFKRSHVTSYAVHPDGQTIFVSTIKKGASAATFAFETEEHGGEWKRHGKWAPPFTGRAHYDGELDAWVGLSADPDSIGHLCSCNVVPASPDAGGDRQCPARKLSKEKLFSEHPTESHVGATLVYMGGRSEFCLVQCVSIEDDCADERCDCNLEDEDDSADLRNGCDLEEEHYCDGCLYGCDLEEEHYCHGYLDDCDMEEASSADERKDSNPKEQDGSTREKSDFKKDEQDVTSWPCRYLFRLTTFHLKYGKNGDLTTGSSCRVQYYRVPKESTQALLSNPVAFWM